MMIPPIAMPSAVPRGPAIGKNVVPGITNAPQPTAQPNDNAHTFSGDKYGFNFVLSAVSMEMTCTPVKKIFLAIIH